MFQRDVISPPTTTTHEPRARMLLSAALITGIGFDIGIRGGFANAVVAGAIGTVIVTLFAAAPRSGRSARGLLLLALLPTAMLAWRASPWLTTSNLAAIGALVTCAVVFGRSGSLFDTDPTAWFRGAGAALVAAAGGWAVVGPLVEKLQSRHHTRLRRVATAILVAGPLVLGVALLLSNADPIFGALITPDVHAGQALSHALLVGVGGSMLLGLWAARGARVVEQDHHGGFGVVETLTMLGLAAAVLGCPLRRSTA